MSSSKWKIVVMQTVGILLFANVAHSSVDLRTSVKLAKTKPLTNSLGLQQTATTNLLTKGQFDDNYSAWVFNWNNASIVSLSLDPAMPMEQQYRQALNGYFSQIAYRHGANKWSVAQSKMTSLHDTGRGGVIGKYSQQVNGVEVFGRHIAVLINRKNEFVASSGYFVNAIQAPVANYQLSELEALATAFYNNTGQLMLQTPLLVGKKGSEYLSVSQSLQSSQYQLTENSRVKKVYFDISSNSNESTDSLSSTDKLIPAYYVEAQTNIKNTNESNWVSYVIDGTNGAILFENNLTSHVSTTYKVFADSQAPYFPFDGPQGNELSPHPSGDLNDTPEVGQANATQNSVTLDYGPISTNDPWLADSASTTSGNNVDAYADISGSDGFDDNDVRPEMSSANAFEFDFATNQGGLAGQAQKHAIVSLFYTNNFLHDWFYDNGFDEQAGNAQLDNYARGGVGGDPLQVEAQDYSGFNNANMSTPSDGISPKMQMYLWDFNKLGVEVAGVSDVEAGAAEFGPQDFDLTGELVLVDDGVSPVDNGCEVLAADLTGMIVIIERGDCTFTVKVKNAQDAGAAAVIVVNHTAEGEFGGGVITMGGEDSSITIASLFVSLEKGAEIKSALINQPGLAVRLFNLIQLLDGTLDNGIVAHEWGHYLSNRLVGNSNGLSNNQGRSMGEGWSDFIALLLNVRESDRLVMGNENFQGVYSASTFIGNAYYGFRRVPYSSDLNKNGLTFKHIENGVGLPLNHPVSYGISGANNAEVHNAGEVWATVLWDIFVGLVNKPGNSFEQARETIKDYLVSALKLTPNSPTMLEARDAILAAAIANDPQDFEIIRDIFSRRGMGATAQAPTRNSVDHFGVVEDFSAGADVVAAIQLDPASINSTNCDYDSVLDVGEAAQLNLTFSNYSALQIPPFEVNLSSPNDIAFSNNPISVEAIDTFASKRTKSVEFTLNSANFMQAIELTATVPQIGANENDFVEPPPNSLSLMANFDFVKTAQNDDMSVPATSQFDWQVVADSNLSAFAVTDSAWHGVDNPVAGSSSLVTPEIKVASSGDFLIGFDHFYWFESSPDDDGTMLHWDGGVIEISVDGGAWVDVVDFGGILSEPYNGVLESFNDILGGRQAYTFTRDPADFSTQLNTLTFDEGLVNGHNIRLRFRIGSDANTGDFGWLIDNFVVNNAINPLFSEIVAEDNQCLSASAPVVDAGQDINLTPTDNNELFIELSGSAFDPDGDPLNIQWAQRLGPTASLNTADSLAASFSLLSPTIGTKMVFELTVSDGGYTVSDLVNVNIIVNNPPSVSAVGGRVLEGEVASLMAIGRDVDGNSLTYQWTQISGPEVILSGSTSLNATFTAPFVEMDTVMTFQIIANDGIDNSIATTASVTVLDQPQQSSRGGGACLAIILLTGFTVFCSRSNYRI